MVCLGNYKTINHKHWYNRSYVNYKVKLKHTTSEMDFARTRVWLGEGIAEHMHKVDYVMLLVCML